jgi:hypothetical protein
LKAGDIFPGLKKGPDGKFVEPKNPWFGKKKKAEKPPINYKKINTTRNLHASKFMPKDERLNFIDPKTVELPIKIVPRLKAVVEAMSASVKKPMRPWLTYAVGGIIASIALVIVYNQIIAPQQDAEHEFLLKWQEQCAAQNMTNCAVPTVPNAPGAAGGSGGGGGLFDFKLVNPLQPPGSFS